VWVLVLCMGIGLLGQAHNVSQQVLVQITIADAVVVAVAVGIAVDIAVGIGFVAIAIAIAIPVAIPVAIAIAIANVYTHIAVNSATAARLCPPKQALLPPRLLHQTPIKFFQRSLQQFRRLVARQTPDAVDLFFNGLPVLKTQLEQFRRESFVDRKVRRGIGKDLGLAIVVGGGVVAAASVVVVVVVIPFGASVSLSSTTRAIPVEGTLAVPPTQAFPASGPRTTKRVPLDRLSRPSPLRSRRSTVKRKPPAPTRPAKTIQSIRAGAA